MLKGNRYFLIVLCSMLFVAAFASVSKIYAQSKAPLVRAVLEPDSVAIGDQFKLNVTVTKDLVQMVDFPVFDNKTMAEKIEILNQSDVDTIARDGRTVTLKKSYLLTIFDAGNYSMGRFPVLYSDKNIIDTLWSRDLLMLQVGTFEIDTLKQQIYDIREQMKTPLKIGEISGYIGWGLLIAAVIALAVLFFVKHRKRLPIFGKPTPDDPAHVVAIRALEELHNQKIWQNNKHKQYYTRLTDIVREYLEGRFMIHAPEMTSDEIMDVIALFKLPQQSSDNLRRLLKSADMVKFAKYIPDAEDNEAAYTYAYYFVEQTKPTEVEPPKEPAQQATL